MNKKLMSLAFVTVVSGCHTQQQAAVCPATEEEVMEPEASSGEAPVEEEKLSEVELERARRNSRGQRFLPSR